MSLYSILEKFYYKVRVEESCSWWLIEGRMFLKKKRNKIKFKSSDLSWWYRSFYEGFVGIKCCRVVSFRGRAMYVDGEFLGWE